MRWGQRNEQLIDFVINLIHKCIFVLNQYHCKRIYNLQQNLFFLATGCNFG